MNQAGMCEIKEKIKVLFFFFLLVSSGNVPFFNLKAILHLLHTIPCCS